MRPTLTLSIIIVNFNTYQVLYHCLDTLLKHLRTTKISYEVIVADNGSRDSSVQLLRKNYKMVKIIANGKNIGFSAANNKAIQKSYGKYILLLNPDTKVGEGVLEKMVEFMATHPAVGVATTRVELPDGMLDDACHRGFPTPWNALCHFSGLSSLIPTSQFFNGYHRGYKDMDRPHEIDSCVGAFMLVRRKTGEEVGWLDEDYFWYGEDLDFCFRVKEKDWKVMYVPVGKVIHYKGVSSGIKKHSQDLSTADEKIKRLATRARFNAMRIFYRKHYKDKYPKFLTNIVFTGIQIKAWLTNRY